MGTSSSRPTSGSAKRPPATVNGAAKRPSVTKAKISTPNSRPESDSNRPATVPSTKQATATLSARRLERLAKQAKLRRQKTIINGSIVGVVLVALIAIVASVIVQNQPPAPPRTYGLLSNYAPGATGNVKGHYQVVNLGGGLQYADLKVGTGAVVKANDTITANYTGWTTSGTAFDSSTDPTFGHVAPAQFSLDPNSQQRVIVGWQKGLVGMKVGGIRRLYIPAVMAYGATPPQGSNISVNAPLIFEVALVSIP